MNQSTTTAMARTLTAREAAERLGITRQTLYAYVSRGLLRAQTIHGARDSRYLAADVEHLAASRAVGRKPRDVARAALNWGTPVLSSAITLIADGRLYYRGQDAVALAGSAPVEDVAALLWDFPGRVAFPVSPSIPPEVWTCTAEDVSEVLLARFAAVPFDDATAPWQTDPMKVARGCGTLIGIMASCFLGAVVPDAALHDQCAAAWGTGRDGAELIRMALVLCADHELNASGFTARCVASTGASLQAAVIGGLAALSGPRHGGSTTRIEAFWDTLAAARQPQAVLRQRLAGGEALPGFGHPLYPDGDVRATVLLDRLTALGPVGQEWIEDATALTGHRPNVDLALVALRRHFDLPRGSAFGLFALSRSLGWIAHALEQRLDPNLIRPRAVYTGPMPG